MGRKSLATHIASSAISVIPNFLLKTQGVTVNPCDIPNFFTMVWYIVKQRIFIVETYLLKRQNYDRYARTCWHRFPGATVPSKPCVIKLFRKWRELASVQDKKKNRRKTVLHGKNWQIFKQECR